MNSLKINLVFPMGGKAERFGGTFKPFKMLGDLSFIEKAYQPFEKWEEYIDKIYFIFTKEQDNVYNASSKLKEMFVGKDLVFKIIKNQTPGPLQTIRDGVKGEKIENAIVCDCDHSINVDPIFDYLLSNKKPHCLIPTWKIKEDEQKNWSKLVIDEKGEIQGVYEKQELDFSQNRPIGIIGCIFFENCDHFTSVKDESIYISDLIRVFLHSKKNVKMVNINKAYFYGDPMMLENCINVRRNESTIFCDIDGVLFRHKDHSDFIPESNESLPGIEKINLLHSSGHRIVLTTARSKKFKSKLVKLLNVKGVKYDELVMGLPSGPRVLVNDRKPKKPFTKQATSVEISRNGDLSSFNIDDILQGNKTKIVSDLSGNSFAKTYLLSNEGNIFVRKHIIKTSSSKPHCQTLKRQKSDLERLNFLSEDICPKVLREVENEIEYYYDMEFLPSYVQISDLTSDKQSKVLNKVLHKLENEIYIMSKSVNGQEWMENFLNLKIYPKFDSFSLKNDSFYSIINSDLITINGKSFFGLRKVFRMLDYDRLCPSQIGVVHGDLTFENILYNEKSKDVKLIDMDGSRMYDARELDLGKLSQSVFSNYKMWSKSDSLINKINPSKGHYECVGDYFNSSSKIKDELVKKWSEILNQPIEEVENKAMFYMSTYFIRFVPFRLQISQEHGIFALLMATAWLNKVLEKQNENE